ncbi:MAG TPA: hypothetical protein VMV72_04235 [Verrucomicrobiae bacterium]|nr:hypothetical protein [Verrucomicrobiae bacterium]
MSDDGGGKARRVRRVFQARELLIAVGFTLVNASAHLLWNPIVEYWQFVVTALMFVGFLAFWLAKEWRRIGSFVTRFYCVAVIFDVLAEGLLQPFHHCTFDNLMCTGKLFLVFFVFWLVARPVERWMTERREEGIARRGRARLAARVTSRAMGQ